MNQSFGWIASKKFIAIICVLFLSSSVVHAFGKAEQSTYSGVFAEFSYSADSAEIGQPFSFSYKLSGGSGSYSNIKIEAEFITVHNSIGNDVDLQFFEMDIQSSGTVAITPIAGSALILWLRGQDAVTGEEFYFECHQGWIPVKQNQSINVTFQYNHEEAVIGQMLDLQYRIEGISDLSEARIWWQIGSESFSSERLNEHPLNSLSGTTSLTPPYGEYIYVVIQGKDNTGTPFYAESEHIKLINTELKEITCAFSFPDSNPRIGTPYTFSYTISGGSGSYSDISVEAEFVTVHDSRGNDVDIQLIELGSSSASDVSFTPKAGTGLILWLRGKDAITQQSFVFECHSGWLTVESNSAYPVSFAFEKDNYLIGESIRVDYQVGNLDNQLINGKLWWTLISDFYIEDHLNAIDIEDNHGSAEIIPSYGKAFYAVLEGTDQMGNSIYAESKHMILGDEENPSTSLPLNEIIILPTGLTTIDSEAFKGIAAKAIVIPVSVQYIADDAFTDSGIVTLYGRTNYVQEYALAHGFDFIIAD